MKGKGTLFIVAAFVAAFGWTLVHAGKCQQCITRGNKFFCKSAEAGGELCQANSRECKLINTCPEYKVTRPHDDISQGEKDPYAVKSLVDARIRVDIPEEWNPGPLDFMNGGSLILRNMDSMTWDTLKAELNGRTGLPAEAFSLDSALITMGDVHTADSLLGYHDAAGSGYAIKFFHAGDGVHLTVCMVEGGEPTRPIANTTLFSDDILVASVTLDGAPYLIAFRGDILSARDAESLDEEMYSYQFDFWERFERFLIDPELTVNLESFDPPSKGASCLE